MLAWASSASSNIRFGFFLAFVVIDGSSGRYVYQLDEMLGWSWVTTLYGGFHPPRGSLSSSVLGTLVPAASDSSVFDNVVQPGRSASKKQVNFDLLRKTAIKNCVASSERWSASRVAASTVSDGDDREKLARIWM